MAKKFKHFRRIDLDNTISSLYNYGVFQSCIIHSLLFIVLGLLVTGTQRPLNSPIVLSFEPNQEEFQELQEIEILEENTESEIENNTSATVLNEHKYLTIEDVGLNDKVELPDLDITTEHRTLSVDTLLTESEAMDILIKEPSTNTPRPKFRRTTNNIVQNSPTNSAGTGAALTNMEMDTSGVDELNKRLAEYGGRSGDIQISLSWNTIDDIDLHLTLLPIGSNINWTRKVGFCGGVLDIDMNAHPNMLTNRPIENIFWRNNGAPKGLYIIGIHNYMPWSRNTQTEVLVVVKIKGKVQISKKVRAVYGQGVQEVARFNY